VGFTAPGGGGGAPPPPPATADYSFGSKLSAQPLMQ
jgi:hypothetical protein